MNDKRRFLKSNRSLLVILSVVSALLTVYFMPAHRQEKYTFTVGKPWTYDVLIAPFNFSIQKSDEVWQAEADSVKASFAPYFSRNASVSETALARFDKFYNDSLSKVVWEESYLSLRRRLEKVYREGIHAPARNTAAMARILHNGNLRYVPARRDVRFNLE